MSLKIDHGLFNTEHSSQQDIPAECRIITEIHQKAGVVKTYKLSYEIVDTLHPVYDKQSCQNRFVIDPRSLRESMGYFSNQVDEVSLYLTESHVIIRSWASGSLSDTLDPAEISSLKKGIRDYVETSRAIEAANSYLQAYFDSGGDPIIFCVSGDLLVTDFLKKRKRYDSSNLKGNSENSSNDLSIDGLVVEFIIATVPDSSASQMHTQGSMLATERFRNLKSHNLQSNSPNNQIRNSQRSIFQTPANQNAFSVRVGGTDTNSSNKINFSNSISKGGFLKPLPRNLQHSGGGNVHSQSSLPNPENDTPTKIGEHSKTINIPNIPQANRYFTNNYLNDSNSKTTQEKHFDSSASQSLSFPNNNDNTDSIHPPSLSSDTESMSASYSKLYNTDFQNQANEYIRNNDLNGKGIVLHQNEISLLKPASEKISNSESLFNDSARSSLANVGSSNILNNGENNLSEHISISDSRNKISNHQHQISKGLQKGKDLINTDSMLVDPLSTSGSMEVIGSNTGSIVLTKDNRDTDSSDIEKDFDFSQNKNTQRYDSVSDTGDTSDSDQEEIAATPPSSKQTKSLF
ncbi:hypothetical protein BB560_003276 [Smittium megazygosporum]|uniref:Uncharacterized protein n=1 Tax=Smittium megazygosporum TaxID=133381 RepID=A0A2T9ZCE7_9FUNG|nr:hypothetical protein BB560_003276 [Smittium megazygosporum]